MPFLRMNMPYVSTVLAWNMLVNIVVSLRFPLCWSRCSVHCTCFAE